MNDKILICKQCKKEHPEEMFVTSRQRYRKCLDCRKAAYKKYKEEIKNGTRIPDRRISRTEEEEKERNKVYQKRYNEARKARAKSLKNNIEAENNARSEQHQTSEQRTDTLHVFDEDEATG